jgi:hypothetical protein
MFAIIDNFVDSLLKVSNLRLLYACDPARRPLELSELCNGDVLEDLSKQQAVDQV